MIQGPFASGGAMETHEWQVNYSAGQLTTGLDLLTAVFGNPTANGTYTDALNGTYNYFTSTSTYGSAGYIDFGGGSLFTESFTLNGTKVAQDTSYRPGWNYYVAGGSGVYGGNNVAGSNSSYTNGSWTYSNDGSTSRKLADGSFDGWVYGGTFPPATISGDTSNNAPVVSNFSSATVINFSSTPEPGRPLLLVFGLITLVMRRRRVIGKLG